MSFCRSVGAEKIERACRAAVQARCFTVAFIAQCLGGASWPGSGSSEGTRHECQDPFHPGLRCGHRRSGWSSEAAAPGQRPQELEVPWSERAESERWSCSGVPRGVATEEVAQRQQTRVQRAVRQARFPFLKTIDDFDFSLQSSLRLQLLGSYLYPRVGQRRAAT